LLEKFRCHRLRSGNRSAILKKSPEAEAKAKVPEAAGKKIPSCKGQWVLVPYQGAAKGPRREQAVGGVEAANFLDSKAVFK
jgi:hypothetical protein